MDRDGLQAKIETAPKTPGVYFWKDETGQIIYIGKAKVLYNRVRSYFQRVEEKDPKTRLLVRHIADLDWLVTGSEKEAVILEAALIRQHLPRFNLALRDDKNFISLKLDLSHPFPRLYVVRKAARDGNLYYGPFSNARAIRQTLHFINTVFQLRKCTDRNFAARRRPCLQHQIGRCHAPCVGSIDQERYARIVEEVRLFFTGRITEILPNLEREMRECAAALKYEEAARVRDRLQAIRASLEKQRIVAHGRGDRDAFGMHRDGAALVICQLFVRGGVLTGNRVYPFKDAPEEDASVLRQLLGVYYAQDTVIPGQILLPLEPEGGLALLSEWFGELAGNAVELRVAQRGEGRELTALAAENARQYLEARHATLIDAADVSAEIMHKLGLPRAPETIECFDVSNLQGKQPVAAAVRFRRGEPEKSGYRRYKIRGKDEPDDYAMLREALTRRLTRGREDDDLPDLLLIDGGKGQLGVAVAVLEELEIRDQMVAAITKIRDLPPGDPGPTDKIHVPGRKNAVHFRANSHALRLLQRIRDEAHRFAITHHRLLRSKNLSGSELDAVPGLGAAKKKALLKTFGSVKRIKEAGEAELTQAPGIGGKLAAVVYRHLHPS